MNTEGKAQTTIGRPQGIYYTWHYIQMPKHQFPMGADSIMLLKHQHCFHRTIEQLWKGTWEAICSDLLLKVGPSSKLNPALELDQAAQRHVLPVSEGLQGWRSHHLSGPLFQHLTIFLQIVPFIPQLSASCNCRHSWIPAELQCAACPPSCCTSSFLHSMVSLCNAIGIKQTDSCKAPCP